MNFLMISIYTQMFKRLLFNRLTYQLAFLLASIFLPFFQISNHYGRNLRTILLVSVTFVLYPFLSYLLVVGCVLRLIDRMRPRDLFHCSCCSLLSYIQCNLRYVLNFRLDNLLVVSGCGHQAGIYALQTHDKTRPS